MCVYMHVWETGVYRVFVLPPDWFKLVYFRSVTICVFSTSRSDVNLSSDAWAQNNSLVIGKMYWAVVLSNNRLLAYGYKKPLWASKLISQRWPGLCNVHIMSLLMRFEQMGNSVHVLSSHLTSCFNIKLMFPFWSYSIAHTEINPVLWPISLTQWTESGLHSCRNRFLNRRKYQRTEKGLNEIKCYFPGQNFHRFKPKT